MSPNGLWSGSRWGAVEEGGRLTDVEMSHILRWAGWLKQPSALRPTVQPSVARGGGGLRASCVWILGILASGHNAAFN